MKTKLKMAIATAAAACTLATAKLEAQCCSTYDFSTSAGWTNVGTTTTISSGNGLMTNTTDGPTVAYSWATVPTLSDVSWTCDFEFSLTSGNEPSHMLVSFGEANASPVNHHAKNTSGTVTYANTDCIEATLTCDDIDPCAISSGKWRIVGEAKARTSGAYGYNLTTQPTWSTSGNIFIPSTGAGVTYYGRLQRLSSGAAMISVFTNSTRTTHLAGSPQCFSLPASITNLGVLEFGNKPEGSVTRKLTAKLDNISVCDLNMAISGNAQVCTTSGATPYVLSNGNSCVTADHGFPGATSFTWAGPAGSVFPSGTGGYFTIGASTNTCDIEVNNSGNVSCTVNYPCTTVTYTFAVTTANPATAFMTSSSVFCQGSAITLNGSSSTNETSYQWSAVQCDAIGTPIGSVSYGPLLNGTASTVDLGTIISPAQLICHRYFKVTLTVFNICGSSHATRIIEINCPPDVTVSPANSLLCPNETGVSLFASGATAYSWTPSGSLSCSTCSNPIASPTVNTTYTLSGTTPGCSPDFYLVHVNVSTLGVSILPGADTMHLCCWSELDSFPLAITPGTPSYTINWTPTTDLVCLHTPSHPIGQCPAPRIRSCTSRMYHVSVTDADGCEVKDSIYVLIDSNCRVANPYANEQEPGQSTLSIYPNPAAVQATVSTGTSVAESLIITDALGREVYNKPPSGAQTQIDLSTFPAGVYLVRVRVNGETQVRPIVIEK